MDVEEPLGDIFFESGQMSSRPSRAKGDKAYEPGTRAGHIQAFKPQLYVGLGATSNYVAVAGVCTPQPSDLTSKRMSPDGSLLYL